MAAGSLHAEDRLILRDGMALSGTLDLAGSVAIVKQRHRVYHVSKSALLRPEEDAVIVGAELSFRVPQPRPEKTPTGAPPIAGYARTEPFDEFGRRSVTFVDPAGKQSKQIQLIRTLYPTHAETDLLNAAYKSTSPLSDLAPGGLVKLLRRCIDQKSAAAREKVVQFLLAARRYADADAELAAFAKDFPGEASRAGKLRNDRNRAVAELALSRAQRWAASGQFGQTLALEAELAPLADPDQKRRYEALKGQVRAALANVEALRKRLRAIVPPPHLPEPERQTLAAALAEIASGLSPADAARLQPFETFAAQPAAKPDELAALALTGWRAGPVLARSDLKDALHWWRSGERLAAALAGDEAALQSQLAALAKPPAEGQPPIAADVLARMAALLPAPTTTVPPNQLTPLDAARAPNESAPYFVQLPPDYDRRRQYPLLVALVGRPETPEQYAKLWSGAAADHGWILVVPKPPPGDAEYGYSLEEHLRLAAILRDARLRFAVDADRVALTGHGTGGVAAWDYAAAHPDEFAGLVPFLAPPLKYAERHYGPNLATLPTFAAMGGLDNLGAAALHRFFAEQAKGTQQFVYVVYPSRGGGLGGEIETAFDWLSRRRREAYPHQISAVSARPGDRDFHWLRIDSHRAGATVPPELFGRSKVTPAKLTGAATDANALLVKCSGVESLTIRLGPGLAALDDAGLTIKVNGKVVHKGALEPDVETMIREIRRTGDRQRLVLKEIPVHRVP